MIQCERTEPDCDEDSTTVLEYPNGLRWAFCTKHAAQEVYGEGATVVVTTRPEYFDLLIDGPEVTP